jgi:hypothetical protein
LTNGFNGSSFFTEKMRTSLPKKAVTLSEINPRTCGLTSTHTGMALVGRRGIASIGFTFLRGTDAGIGTRTGHVTTARSSAPPFTGGETVSRALLAMGYLQIS